jgi:PKD repeat protein
MNDQLKIKILAVEIVLLIIISGTVGYIILSKPKLASINIENEENDNIIQDTIKVTSIIAPSSQAHIRAGPLVGYGPLKVSFYGNPYNDSDVSSYNWEFRPKTMPIVPISQYKNTYFSIGLFLVFTLLFFPLGFAYAILSSIVSHYRYKSNSQYESSERNPTMVFLYTGSYSAKLTVTDTQGNTSSDIVWITVLQYVYPDND